MTFEKDCEQTKQPDDQEIPLKLRFRRVLAQFLATSVKNLILFDIGLQKSIPGIIIPALTGLQNEFNRDETLTLTPDETSWLGSIAYILVPLGSLISGPIADAFGRRRAMLLVNIPFICCWFMLYQASSVIEIFIAYALLGFSVGLTEAPIITYIGEICEPSMRGMMIAYSSFSVTLGCLFIFILNTFMSWRMASLVCMFVPILTVIGLCLVPETPQWLLSKNRTDDAEKSLQWLRGWVEKPTIANELQELRHYSKRSLSCDTCFQENKKCPHPQPTLREKIQVLMQPQILKPFFIATSLFAISVFVGLNGMVPYIVQIYKAYDSPIPPDQSATVINVDSNLAIASFLTLLRFTGKRPLYLTMLGGMVVVSGIVSVYGFILLPSGYNSFDQANYFSVDVDHKVLTYIPFICMFLWNFGWNCGVNSMGNQMLSELFPYKTRGLTAGIIVALSYVFNFIAVKLYYDLETGLSLPGYTLCGCTVAAIGWILMYNILPETEGRSLEDIELHFSDKTKKLTDHKIPMPKKIILKKECNLNEINGSMKTTNGTSLSQPEENDFDDFGFVNSRL